MKSNCTITLLCLAFMMMCSPISSAKSYRKNVAKDEANVNKEIKPITGTWVNLAYKDVRNKYTNPQYFDNTDPKLWEAKVRELSKMGIEYLVLMEVANDGKSYYPSKIMPWLYDAASKSPVDAILDEAAKHNMKVFMSTGWAKNQDDNLLDPEIKKRQLEIMEELSKLYSNKKTFYGWYLPVEDCLCPIFAEHAVQSVNSLVERANQLTPGKKTLISPYGIGLSNFDDPNYEKQLKKLKVDIIAYQDEVGCVRDKFTLPRLKKNWQRMRDIHNRLNIEMWANCETFTWEQGTNDRQSALIPAAYSRLLSQQVAASQGGVDRIISFMFGGIIEDPYSPYQLGQPLWSNEPYRNYMSWKRGDYYWKLFEATLTNKLKNNVPASTKVSENIDALIDNKVGEENSQDNNWNKFNKGYNEVVLNFNTNVHVKDVFIRTLNYNQENITPMMKAYIFFSNDGKKYSLASIKDTQYFPNNKHDAWIDGVLFKDLNVNAKYMKVAFYGIGNVYMDELYVNPTIK